MVDVQDSDAHPHKRTAIHQLLNPVSSSPTKRQEDHAHASYRDSSPTSRPPFHLRAAQWEPTDPSPPNTVHYASSPETNGSVRERSAGYPTYDSGPSSNNGSGYKMTASSFNSVPCYPRGVSNPPSPALHTLQQPGIPFYPDGRGGSLPQIRPESPRSVTGLSTPGDVSGKESPLNAHSPVRTIAGDPRQAYSGPGMPGYRLPPQFLPPIIQVPVIMPYPPAPPKRPNVEGEESSNTPRKKPRISSGKVDGFVAPKRGYTAKKRSEAAQIAAQNAEMMASVTYKPQQREGEKLADKTTTALGNDGTIRNLPVQVGNGGKLHPELQFARCMSHRYRNEHFPRCVSCTRRWAGDTCRFQSIRFFLRDENKVIVGISFVENQKADSPSMDFPKKWNVPLDTSHLDRVKRTVARALLPVLKTELNHLHVPEIIRRPRESDVRATCDTCMTSIFSSSWMCRLCGREACAECFEQVKILTDSSGAEDADVLGLQARREKHARRNPFFLACTKRNEHQAKDFSPMTRFCKTELELVIKEMEELLDSAGPDPPRLEDEILGTDGEATPDDQLGSLPIHRILRFKHGELSHDIFSKLWAKGKPLVVTGLLPRFKINWTPEHFVEHHASKGCLVIHCQSDTNKRITVGEFFEGFGKYEGRKDCWKLKDWPPSTDFKTAFPELYADFSQAIPMPNYVRRDGALNIASHFPSNTVAPDLGPKMYNAMASSDTPGTKGSTRLHMDMADAVNVMLYSTPTPDGKPGGALWDIYDASDAGKIRDFLKNKFKGVSQNDPIHSQMFYLDHDLRKELYESYGVKSYRIYQKPGDVVFIPAGCAHQVCNLADCMKIAIDFVSPENIDRCETLTMEFREQNQSMQWKEDVLQLRTMMWFAWLSCRIHEAAQGKERTNTSNAVAITSVSNKKSSGQTTRSGTPPEPTPMDVDRTIAMLPLD